MSRPLRLALRNALGAGLALGCMAAAVHAAPGDVVVPAHRSSDGTLIPANVPPSSGGTVMPVGRADKRPGRVPRPVGQGKPAFQPIPLFVEARSIRR